MSSTTLSDNQFAKVLEVLLERFDNTGQPLDPKERQELAADLAKTIRQERNAPVQRAELEDPRFVHKLFNTTNMALTFKKEEKELKEIQELLVSKLSPEDKKKYDKFNSLLKIEKSERTPEQNKELEELRKELTAKIKEIKGKLTPEESKKLDAALDRLGTKLLENLERSKIPLPKPKPGGKPGKNEDKELDNALLNLFSIDPQKPGSIPSVVQVFNGNYANLPDASPFRDVSMAPISATDKFMDMMQNNKEHAGSIFGIMNDLQAAARDTPRPSPPGGGQAR